MRSGPLLAWLAGALPLVGCDAPPSDRTDASARDESSQSTASSVGPGAAATAAVSAPVASAAATGGAPGPDGLSTDSASAAPSGVTTDASAARGAPADFVAELGATSARSVTLDRRLAIGSRPKLELPVAVGWRGSTLCFGLDGDPLLFAQSRDKQALVVVLNFCALTAPRCGADAYLTQVGGAASIHWGAESRAELGTDRLPVTVLRGTCTMHQRPAQIWQLLQRATDGPPGRATQVLVALDRDALPERRAELASMLGSLARDEQGVAPALECGADSQRRRTPEL